jgi:SAM-dependent methyltransferase
MDLAQEKLINDVLWRARAELRTSGVRRRVMAEAPPEQARVRARVRNIWMAGDYDRLDRYMAGAAENFYERLRVPLGSRLLDVACGAGRLALIASRHGADATGIDIVESLIARAGERARVEGLGARFWVADAESLPFEDARFDVVTSLVGVMFAADPDAVASELMRVCRPGGMIAMANWTAEGFCGKLLKAVSRYAAPLEMPAPVLWGDEETLRTRFGAGVRNLQFTRRETELNYPFPPDEVVRFFRDYHGPTNRAFAAKNRAGRQSLQMELEDLWSTHNLARGGFTKVDAEWLEMVAVRA